jgi:hypothetical protein
VDSPALAEQKAEVRAALGQLGVAAALLRECLGPLEVSAAVIESEDGGEAIEMLIGQVRKFCADAAAADVNEILEGRYSQHVLKAEGASPDATDRGNRANASPDGGPMGVGPAAAADPAGVEGGGNG